MNTTYIKVCLYLVLLSLPFSSVHSVYLKLSEQNFIPTSTTAGKKIEYYAVWSSKEGPWPVVLYIHGHQHPERMGGKKYLKDKTLGEMAKNGYLAIAISMPGYGNSSGPPDFCGPSTQNAVIALIKYLRTQPFVIPEKIVLIGESRGALVGSMVATKDKKLAGVILISGFYDLKEVRDKRTLGNIAKEAGSGDLVYLQRSAACFINDIKIPLLIFHGKHDKRAPVDSAIDFFKKLSDTHQQLDLQLILFNCGHHTPHQEVTKIIDSFLEKKFK